MFAENGAGLTRWIGCEHATTRTADEPPQDGLNSGYACSSPDVVSESISEMVDEHYGDIEKKVVEFFPAGSTTLAGVHTSLNVRCPNCRFYKKREQ